MTKPGAFGMMGSFLPTYQPTYQPAYFERTLGDTCGSYRFFRLLDPPQKQLFEPDALGV